MKISKSILILGLINALACVIIMVVADRLGMYQTSPSFLMIAFFVCFVVAYLITWYFYYVITTRRISALAEKIRVRFLSSEVPRRYNHLEEADGIGILEEKVDHMIESRQKELDHFENLDSYRKEYLGNVSHELKTPVFNIQGYIDTLLNGGLEDKTINVDYLQRAEKSIDRLISIIDDLETITQLESGGLELDVDAFDIAALIKDIYSSLEINASRRNISLVLARKYDKPVMVRADKFRIRQVLANLVMNSIKYGKENGRTLINLSYHNNEVIIEISDNGEGIDEKHLPRIFERFYRIDKGRSREQGGTGLGLAIVKHIIEAHQRSIKVESIKRSGTTFTFSLPAAPERQT